MRGILYNSKKSACSIWESGKMCYNSLKNSKFFVLDYSEDTNLDHSYDFAIFNQHSTVNNWITLEIIQQFNKPTFCIVTEVVFNGNPASASPNYFSHYIILDPTINETNKYHAFGRPLEEFDLTNVDQSKINYDTPEIFSFGFATLGKNWTGIIDAVQNEYDNANIHFNIPKGDYVPTHDLIINEIADKCKNGLYKPGIKVKITQDNLSKKELIELCSTKTINCFLYNRNFFAGLAAVTDQAISSGRPLLISKDLTFRHIHKYIIPYPDISIKDAIKRNSVLNMKNDWSSLNFLLKFEKLLSQCS